MQNYPIVVYGSQSRICRCLPYMSAGMLCSAVIRGSELYRGEVVAMPTKTGKMRDCRAIERLMQPDDFCGTPIK